MALQLPLTKELQMIAETELNEIPSRVESDIAHIRGWLDQQSYIKARTDDSTILLFLRACKFSLEKTKTRFESFYTAKSAFSNIFKNRDPFLPQFQYVFQNNAIAILPSNLNDPTIFIAKSYDIDTDLLTMVDIFKFLSMILDVILREYPNTSIAGIVGLIDFKEIPYKYVSQATPTLAKQFVTCFANCYPVRVKGVYIINAPSIWVSLHNVFKVLIPKKLQNRVFCFNSNESDTIRHHLSCENLPSEYGGNAGSLSDLCNQFKEKFNSYYDWFVEDEQFGCMKNKTPEHFLQIEDLFGLDGSFRKLDID